MKELNYTDYFSIQKEIVKGINALLPVLTDFPCDYLEINDLAETTPSLAIVFLPKAYEVRADMVGSIREVTFQLNYKKTVYDNEDKLEGFKALEYLVDAFLSLNILANNDKINLGIKGTTSPSVIDFDDTGEIKVFQALYTLSYKQMTRGI